jgi:hypothetical protein
VSPVRRASLYAEYADLTEELARAAEAGDLEAIVPVLARRQRIIEESRSDDGPLTPPERAALEAARSREHRALGRLAALRQSLMASFRELARARAMDRVG